jgi:hypothetical protein
LLTFKKNVEITIKIHETARYQCDSGCSTQIYIDSLRPTTTNTIHLASFFRTDEAQKSRGRRDLGT